uniref:Uncharacterized protein n=1 Tax=Tanacetum cinerariifolium TaxID=118510 RepID=A0A699TG59_TANCI|nr:hypothetical protein [Tanacetum cinerariifolium]
MMWGLHKAFYMESQRQIAQLYSLAPVSGARRGGWRQRLSQAVHFPSRDEVYRFLDQTVRPAIEDVTAVFVEKGLSMRVQQTQRRGIQGLRRVTQPDPAIEIGGLRCSGGDA